MDTTVPVLIVGAGPAGLIMALSLAQNGIKFRIIDRDDKFHEGSRGFGIQPRTYELFKSLGILPDVQALATEIPTMRAYKPGELTHVKQWDLYEKAKSWPDRPFGNGTCLSQSKLEEIIRMHLAKFNSKVELSTELIALEESKSGDAINCTLVVPSPDGKKTEINVSTGYVVGCDGAKGSTRKLLTELTFQGDTLDADGMVWSDVEITGLSNDYWHVWGVPDKFTIMARPLSPNKGNVFGVGVTGKDFDPKPLASSEKLANFINDKTGRKLTFNNFSWLSYFKPNMRMVNKFQQGRAFVVGDAAHVHSPTGGQGMNCSVQDSANLSWKLALVIKKLAPPDLLSSYDSERLPVIYNMLQATTALYKHTVASKEQADTQVSKAERESSGWFRWRNDALQMYGINYRFSDIVVDERRPKPLDANVALAHAYDGYEGTGTLEAGDRAPEIPDLVLNGSETSLFALLKSSLHTILIFAVEGKEKIVEDIYNYVACSALSAEVIQVFVISTDRLGSGNASFLEDKGGYGRKHYFVVDGEVDVVVVRPDTFIGAIVKDERGVQRYFSKILASNNEE